MQCANPTIGRGGSVKLRDLLQELDPVSKSDKARKHSRPEIRLELPVEPVIDFFEGDSSSLNLGDDIALGREVAGELLLGHRYGIGRSPFGDIPETRRTRRLIRPIILVARRAWKAQVMGICEPIFEIIILLQGRIEVVLVKDEMGLGLQQAAGFAKELFDIEPMDARGHRYEIEIPVGEGLIFGGCEGILDESFVRCELQHLRGDIGTIYLFADLQQGPCRETGPAGYIEHPIQFVAEVKIIP